MGIGIALLLSQQNVSVTLHDNNPIVLEGAREKLKHQLQELQEYHLIGESAMDEALKNVTYSVNLENIQGSWMVIEAVPEILELKQEVFQQIENICERSVILATNTSGLPINDLAQNLMHPERFIGTHFFMPASAIPLIEVIKGEKTSETVCHEVIDFYKQIGKKPVLIQKDVPGFIGNRIQHAMAREAISLFEAGVASAEDIDMVVRWSLGVRLLFTGPLEQRDLNGLDVHHHIASYLYKDLENRTEPSEMLSKKVKLGELGLKTGKGFYQWTDEQQKTEMEKKNLKLLQLMQWLKEKHPE
ncbi:3-hydroxybutyryl-CoA dehydrogenase [Bacillus sp. V5-8f]|nr:3-hydroxybutyryl-CoA dehydrogenase [Bacillus sp. V5-8f]